MAVKKKDQPMKKSFAMPFETNTVIISTAFNTDVIWRDHKYASKVFTLASPNFSSIGIVVAITAMNDWRMKNEGLLLSIRSVKNLIYNKAEMKADKEAR